MLAPVRLVPRCPGHLLPHLGLCFCRRPTFLLGSGLPVSSRGLRCRVPQARRRQRLLDVLRGDMLLSGPLVHARDGIVRVRRLRRFSCPS